MIDEKAFIVLALLIASILTALWVFLIPISINNARSREKWIYGLKSLMLVVLLVIAAFLLGHP